MQNTGGLRVETVFLGANGWWAGPDKVATCDCERSAAIWKFGLQMRLVLGFAAILALSTRAVALYTGFAAHHEGAISSPSRTGCARTGSLWRWPIFTVPAAAGTEFRTLLTGSVIRLSGRAWRWTPPEMWSGTAETPGAGAGANDALTVAGLGACVVGVVLVLLLSRRDLGSVGGLTTAARNPGRGDLSSRVAVKGNDEIAELGHAFNAPWPMPSRIPSYSGAG